MGKDKKKITRWWFDRRFYILILVRATEAKTSHLKSVWKKKNKRTKKKRFKQRWNKGDTHITNLGSTLPRKSLVQISSSRILLENSEFVNEQDNIDRNQPGKSAIIKDPAFAGRKRKLDQTSLDPGTQEDKIQRPSTSVQGMDCNPLTVFSTKNLYEIFWSRENIISENDSH